MSATTEPALLTVPETWPAAGLVWGYRLMADGRFKTVEHHHLEGPLKPGTRLWLHFNLSDARAQRWLKGCAWLPAEAREHFFESDDRPGIRPVENGVVGAVADLHFNFSYDPDQIAMLHFYFDEQHIVTGRRQPLQSVDRIHQAVKDGFSYSSTVAFAAHLLHGLAEGLQAVVGKLEADVGLVQDRVLNAHIHRERKTLAALRRLAVRLEQSFSGARVALTRFFRKPPSWFKPEDLEVFNESVEELAAAVDDLQVVRDRCKMLEEEVAARLAEETNRNLYILSIVTTLFLPLNLVTGVFGMNTGGLPFAGDNHPGGFAVVMIMMGVVALGTIVLLHWKRLF